MNEVHQGGIEIIFETKLNSSIGILLIIRILPRFSIFKQTIDILDWIEIWLLGINPILP